MARRIAFLFAGQGAYRPGFLRTLIGDFQFVRDTLDEIDAFSVRRGFEPVSTLLTDPGAATLDELMSEQPAQLDLAIFAGSIASYQIMSATGLRADVLAGHSFGELTALTTAGAITVSDAIRLVCDRALAFRRTPPPPGGMVAVPLDGRRAAHLVGFIDDPTLALAVENGPEQCVFSGPAAALGTLERIMTASDVKPIRLAAAYPFHNPVLSQVAGVLADMTMDLPVSMPRLPVYSSLLRRYVESPDDVRALVADHLTKPVMFYDGLLRLHRDGVRTFVEVGCREILTPFVRACLPPSTTALAATLSSAPVTKLVESLRAAGIKVNDSAATTLADVSSAPAAAQVQRQTITPPAGVEAGPSTGTVPQGDRLMDELRLAYADMLDLPDELLTDDVDLEADLGVDSLKQIESFEQLRKRYQLGELPDELRVTAYTTLPQIAKLIRKLDTAPGAAA